MKQKVVKLGFIGIGLMGEPMTLRLLNAGYEVFVWTRNPDKLKKLSKPVQRHVYRLVK